MSTISCAAVRIGRVYLRPRQSVSYPGFPFMGSSDVSCATCTRSASRGLGFLWSDTSPCLCRAFRCLHQVRVVLPGALEVVVDSSGIRSQLLLPASILRFFLQSVVGVGQATRSAFVSSYGIRSTSQGGDVVQCLLPPASMIFAVPSTHGHRFLGPSLFRSLRTLTDNRPFFFLSQVVVHITFT